MSNYIMTQGAGSNIDGFGVNMIKKSFPKKFQKYLN